MNRFEIPLIEQRFQQASQEILCGFQSKKGGRLLRMSKTSQLRYHRPEQLQQSLAQATQSDDVSRSAGWKIWLAQHLIIRERQRPLGDQDENIFGRDSRDPINAASGPPRRSSYHCRPDPVETVSLQWGCGLSQAGPWTKLMSRLKDCSFMPELQRCDVIKRGSAINRQRRGEHLAG